MDAVVENTSPPLSPYMQDYGRARSLASFAFLSRSPSAAAEMAAVEPSVATSFGQLPRYPMRSPVDRMVTEPICHAPQQMPQGSEGTGLPETEIQALATSTAITGSTTSPHMLATTVATNTQ
jgi:hypothetical protein